MTTKFFKLVVFHTESDYVSSGERERQRKMNSFFSFKVRDKKLLKQNLFVFCFAFTVAARENQQAESHSSGEQWQAGASSCHV